MEWTIFHLQGQQRQPMGSYHLHAQEIRLPPGHYEAVGNWRGQTRSREFWLQHNTTSKVILAMD
ncbi:MAG: hypothetical protein R3E95_07935 [Thiolinea sp.]